MDDSPASRAERALAGVFRTLRQVGDASSATVRLTREFTPLLTLLGKESEVSQEQLSDAIDVAFVELYKHPLTQ